MAIISDARAVFGLSALGSPIGTNVSGSLNIGVAQTQLRLDSVNVAHSVRAIIASDDFVINSLTGSTSGSTAFVAGAAQVETATVTAAGGITTSGNATVTVTAAGMTGSPKAISVALTTTAHTTATLIATAIAAALNADAAYSAMFTATTSTNTVITTRKPTASFTVPGGTLNLYAANDGTLNVALADGTCVGITTAASSANTTSGVVSSGVKIYDGDQKDAEGEALRTINIVQGVIIQVTDGQTAYTNGIDELGKVFGNSASGYIGTRLLLSNDPVSTIDMSTLTFTDDTSPIDMEITILGIDA
jgi:hypothetical protein